MSRSIAALKQGFLVEQTTSTLRGSRAPAERECFQAWVSLKGVYTLVNSGKKIGKRAKRMGWSVLENRAGLTADKEEEITPTPEVS